MRKNLLFTLLVMLMLPWAAKAQVPVFQENFNGGTIPTTWTIIDGDGDGFTWQTSSQTFTTAQGHNSTDCAISGSYDHNTGTVLYPDNWLITPAITLGAGGGSLSFYVNAQDNAYPAEHYGVYVSTTSATDTSSFTLLYQETIIATRTQSAWVQHTIDLTAYAGNTIYVAFRHFDCHDQFYLNLDDIVVTSVSSDPIISVSSQSVDLGYCILGDTTSPFTITVAGYNLTSAINISVSGSFEISDDGILYGSALSMPATGGTMYVRGLATTTGTNYGTISLSSGITAASVDVTMTGLDCSTIITPPYTESFENYGSEQIPFCWRVHTNSADNSYPTILNNSAYSSDGSKSFYFYFPANTYAYTASPAIDLSAATPGDMAITFDMYIYSSISYTNLEVGYMTDPNDVSTFHLLRRYTPMDIAAVGTHYPQTIILQESFSAPVHLAFHVPESSTYTNVIIDNLKIGPAPTCSAPSNLHFSNITGTAALISWDAAPFGVTDYTVEYSEDSMNVWTPVVVTTNSAVISGLAPGVTYNVMVYSNCVGETADTITSNFTTNPCLAQDPNSTGEVSIGTGSSTSSYLPFYGLYNYSYSQQIYDASEVNKPAGGLIDKISFYCSSAPTSTTTGNIRIWMANTTKSTFSSVTDYLSPSQLTEVMVISGNRPITSGWNTFELDIPFIYNGTDNLLVAYYEGYDTYSSSSFYAHSTTTNKSAMHYSDTYSNVSYTNPSTASGSTNFSMMRNNIKLNFTGCDSTTTCAAPSPYVQEVDNESVTIGWTPGNSESSWELEYKLSSDNTWTSEGTVSTSPYVISNLTSNASYDFRMRANCGSEYSAWTTPLTVATECAAIATLPINEGFESATASGSGNMIDCWKTLTNYTSTIYPYTSNSQHATGNYSVYFYGSSSSYSCLVSPRLDNAIAMNNLQIAFKAYKTTDDYSINVGIMSDPNDITTFELLGTVSPGVSSEWQIVDVNTANYTGNGHYVAFLCPIGATSYMYIDDINIDVIPACEHVANLTADIVTDVAATISWDGLQGMNYEVYIAPADAVIGFDTVTWIPVYADTTYTFMGLAQQTTYRAYVRTDCGSEYSDVRMVNFRTGCTPENIPYNEDFTTFTNAFPQCWERYSGLASSSVTQTTNLTATTSGWNFSSNYVFGTGHGKVNIYGSCSYWLVSPVIDLTNATAPILNFDLALTDYANANPIENVGNQADDQFIVFVSTDYGATWSRSNAVVWNNTSTGDHSYDQINYQGENVTISLAQYAGQPIKIAFYGESTVSGGDNDLHIDNLYVGEVITCPRPAVLNLVSTNSSSVTLSWVEAGTATGWNVVYGPAGFNPDTAVNNIVNVQDTFVTIGNLAGGTVYDFYVQADCGGDQSVWRGPVSATPGSYDMHTSGWDTLYTCGSVIYDDGGPTGSYSNSVDAYLVIYPDQQGSFVQIHGTLVAESSTWDRLTIYDGVGTANQILVTDQSSSGVTYQIPTITSTTGPLTLYFHTDGSGVYAGYEIFTTCVNCVSPSLTVDSAGIYEAFVSWSNYTGTATDFELVWGQTGFDPDDSVATTVSNVTSYVITGLNDNTAYDVYIRVQCDDGSYATWTHASFTTLPSCPRPVNFMVTAVTASSVTLSWTEVGPATEWEVEYGVPGFTHGTGTTVQATTNPFDVTNLTDNTAYQFYVRAVCSTTDQSEWSEALLCSTVGINIATLPYNCDFEDATENAAWTIVNGNEANKWYIGGAVNNGGDSALYISNDNGATNNYTISTAANVWAYRDIQFDSNMEFILSFNWRAYAESCCDYIKVFLGTPVPVEAGSSSTPAGATQIGQYNLQSNWQTENVTLNGSQYSNTTKRLYFLWHNDGSVGTMPPGAIDNIVLMALTCPAPANFVASGTTNSSVTLSWTAVGTETEWEIEYGAPGFSHGTGTTVQATTNTFTVTGLTVATSYQFYVRAVCSTTDQSMWVGPITAATDCDILSTFPYTENFDAVTSSLPACWNSTGSATNWEVTSSFHGSVSSAHSGSSVLQFYQGGSGNQATLQLPTFDLTSLTNPTLSFWYTNESWSGDQDQMTVYYRTSTTGSWIQLATYNSSVSTWTYDSLALPSPSATYQIKIDGISGYGYGINLDDVSIYEGSGSGPAVTDPTVATNAASSIGQTNATLNGTITNPDGVTITAKGFEWKATTGGTYAPIAGTGSGNTFTANLTGLTANTGYTFKAFITYNGTTVYGSELTFNTLDQQQETCAAPTNVTASNITNNSADISWTQQGDVTNWDVNYRVAGADAWNSVTTTTNPYTLSGLSDNTSYEVQVIAHCTNGVTSDPSVTITLTTTGINGYTLDNTVTVYPNPTTGMIQIQNSESRIENVEVYDAYGKMLNVVSVNDNVTAIDLTSYASGTYFVKIVTENGVVTKRVVKM